MAENHSDKLQEVLVADLIDRIRNGQTVVDKDGNTVRVPCPSGVLAAAIQYLKQFPPTDETHALEVSRTLQQYGARLPFKASKAMKVN